jgi:hypothetical protein
MALGRKTGGRARGTPNKRTAYRRQVEQALAEGHKADKGATLAAVEKFESIADRFLQQAATAARRNNLTKELELLERAARVLKDLAPAQIGLSGDEG